MLYASFSGVQAPSRDHAVEDARRRVRLVMACAGVFSEGVAPFEIRDVFVHFSGSPLWGTSESGWRSRGGRLNDDSFAAVTDVAELLTASDDLATRIQEAVVHLHRAGAASDYEETFDEAWKVLEILTGKAIAHGAGMIAYFPLIKAPRGLDKMRGVTRQAFVESQYRENLDRFKQMADVRNNIIHRNIARADWHVLEQHSTAAVSFARDAISVGITAWKSPTIAARTPDDMISRLEAAYKKMGVTLPKENDLRPE